jgi:ribose 5-phosphate isomerase
MSQNENELKMTAAESAVALVRDGMIVGLGPGTRAAFAVAAIGRRVKQASGSSASRLRNAPLERRARWEFRSRL